MTQLSSLKKFPFHTLALKAHLVFVVLFVSAFVSHCMDKEGSMLDASKPTQSCPQSFKHQQVARQPLVNRILVQNRWILAKDTNQRGLNKGLKVSGCTVLMFFFFPIGCAIIPVSALYIRVAARVWLRCWEHHLKPQTTCRPFTVTGGI